MSKDPMEPFEFLVVSGVGGFGSGKPGRPRGFVDVTMRGERMQIPAAKAREIAGMLYEAAEAATHDAVTVQFMREKVGMSLDDAVAVLSDYRELRDRMATCEEAEAES